MRKLLCIFFLTFCLLVVQAKEKEDDDAEADDSVADDSKDDAADDKDDKATEKKDSEQKKDETAGKEDSDEESDEEDEKEAEPEEKEDKEEKAEETKEFVCNLKYKRIGCYADKGKKEKPLQTFLMSDSEMGGMTKKGKLPKANTFNGELPKFACKCANEALTSGNAIFGVQNIAECWSGPDDSKYDKDGPSDDCVTFDFASCAPESEICAGKKHSNFMYYIDTPEHTKTQEEINKELEEDKKKQAADEKKKEKKKAASKKKSKKSKKSKH